MDGAAPDPAGSARVPQGSRAQASPLVDSHGSLTATGRTALSALCAAELRRRALLVDPERLLELTALRLAAFAPPGEGVSWDQDWVEECVSGSIDQARRTDRERAASGAGLDGEDYDFLVETFFVFPEDAARSAHAFNQLPRATRRATLELLLHAKPIQTCLDEGIAEDQSTLVERARAGILTIMQIDEAMLESKPRRSRKGGAAP